MSDKITAEELAGMDLAGVERGMVEGWEYVTLYRKRANPDVQVIGPHNWPSPVLRKGARQMRRRKVTSYGEFEPVKYSESGDAIEDSEALELLRYLASLSDPENLEERGTVTLADLILKAQVVLDGEEK